MFTEVGVKKKSFCGSINSDKPCLHIDFGKFLPGTGRGNARRGVVPTSAQRTSAMSARSERTSRAVTAGAGVFYVVASVLRVQELKSATDVLTRRFARRPRP
jgi:hypothetical protein